MDNIEEGCPLVSLRGLHFRAVGTVLAAGDYALSAETAAS